LLAAVAGLTLAVSVVAVPSTDADNATQPDISGLVVYTIDAATAVVHVNANLAAVPKGTDRCSGTFIIRLPFGAANHYNFAILPTNNSRSTEFAPYWQPIAFASTPGRPDLVDVTVRSGCPKDRDDPRRNELGYDIVGHPPRSEFPGRVSSAFYGFSVLGIGSPDAVSYSVVVPDSVAIEPLDESWTKTDGDGITTYSHAPVEDPDNFEVPIVARDDRQLTRSALTTEAGNQFIVQHWPGDTTWSQFVQAQITSGVPVLQQMIGQEWPIDGALEVREAYTPYLYGYAGWFSALTNELEMGEDLNPEVVLHELSHAWFNKAWFSDRWLNEGFAQVYSNAALRQMGAPSFAPAPISPSDPGASPLDAWGDPTGTDGGADTEQFGYNAAFYVVQQIVDEIGVEAMQQILTMVASGEPLYSGDADDETTGEATDWRRFLDLVEFVGGSQQAAELFQQYVIPPDQRDVLEQRASARTAYAALEAHGDEWAAPVAVRRLMASWSFAEATNTMEQADYLLALRDELDAAVAEIGTTYSPDLQAVYENADDLAEATAIIEAHYSAAIALLNAVRAQDGSHGAFETIGLAGDNIDQTLALAGAALARGDVATAKAKAQRVTRAIDDGSSTGLVRLASVQLLAVLAAGLVLFAPRRRSRAASAQQLQAVDPAAEDGLGVGADPVETGGEQAEGIEVGAHVAIEQVPEVDLTAHPTTDSPPDSE